MFDEIRDDLKVMVEIAQKNLSAGRFDMESWYAEKDQDTEFPSIEYVYGRFVHGDCNTTACLLGGALTDKRFIDRGGNFNNIFECPAVGSPPSDFASVMYPQYGEHAVAILDNVFYLANFQQVTRLYDLTDQTFLVELAEILSDDDRRKSFAHACKYHYDDRLADDEDDEDFSYEG